MLTDSSRAVLRGEIPLEFREDPKKPAAVARRSGGARLAIAAEDQGLWDALRECRQSLASEHDVPAYVIFHDRTLHEMLQHRPQSASAMLEISGVGQTKLDRYGEKFLSILRDQALSA